MAAIAYRWRRRRDQRAPGDPGRHRDVVDADRAEPVGGEQLQGHIGDIGLGRRGTPPSAGRAAAVGFHHLTPSFSAPDAILWRPARERRRTAPKGAPDMEPSHNETETGTELVTETLVEEVSIDGMCGVY